MSFLERLFPKNTPITSTSIIAERERAESEIVSHRAKLEGALASVATMTDAEHQKAEAENAASRRAIVRLESRIAHLQAELPKVIEAEEAAKRAAMDDALRARAEASRAANTVEAEKLLADYEGLAFQVGDILARLDEIAAETNAVNAELHRNPVADGVVGFSDIHRKRPQGHYELPLSGLVLPPAFAGEKAAWPRS